MKSLFRSLNLHCAVLLCGLLGGMSAAWAEKADRDKPMNAEADSLRYDDVTQTSVFTGNVVITKGTLIIRADRVEVRQDNEGYQFGQASSSGGKRAFFRQKRDAGDEWIEGEAEQIVFDGKADTVNFSRQAIMRRLSGTKLLDEAQGAQIIFNNSTETFFVTSGAAAGSTSNPGGRVRVVINPKTASPGQGASPAASTGGSSPSPVLVPSPRLGSPK